MAYEDFLLPYDALAESAYSLIKLAETAREMRQAFLQAEKDTDPNPTPEQIESESFRRGRFRWEGLPIDIENPQGGIRRGVNAKTGEPWEVHLNAAYGFIPGYPGFDSKEPGKDDVDIFIGGHFNNPRCWVVDQVDPDTGKFDEHKLLTAFPDKHRAREAYMKSHAPGWKGLGAFTETTTGRIKEWLADGGPRKGPFVGYAQKWETPAPPAKLPAVHELQPTPPTETKVADDHTHCPTCGGEVTMRCRCLLGDKECAQGHKWHTCPVHHCTVLECGHDAAKARGNGTMGCTCPEKAVPAAQNPLG